MSLVRQTRGGRDNDPAFGARFTGSGPVAELMRARFKVATQRLGLNRTRAILRTDLFRPPASQGELFAP